MVEMNKKCVKTGESGRIQIYHVPNAKEASKHPFSNNNVSPTQGQNAENEGNWGKTRKKFARCARRANILSNISTTPSFIRLISNFLYADDRKRPGLHYRPGYCSTVPKIIVTQQHNFSEEGYWFLIHLCVTVRV